MARALTLGVVIVLTLAPARLVCQSAAIAVRSNVRIRPNRRPDAAEWATADSITGFHQREPRVGELGTERTVVRFLRDVEVLYVQIRCGDSDAPHIRATELRRDADLSGDDNVELLIDSFHDRRGAFVFGTNPNGAMWDAQLVDLDDLNSDWNGIWDVAVSRDSAGWTAIFRIPFSTLRFHAGLDVRFGFNVRRFIRRKNEEDLWRSWGRGQGLYQLLDEGGLVGLDGLTRSRHVELYPYALGRLVESPHDSAGIRSGNGFFGGAVGLDIKAAVTPTLTADLTAHTDFAEVEVDSQVINLTRVPFFFPEKRALCASTGFRRLGTTCSLCGIPGTPQVLLQWIDSHRSVPSLSRSTARSK